MMRLLLFCLVTFAASLTAQTSTPKVGSPERKALMDALRVPVTVDLKQPVIFKVDRLKVLDRWAFVGGAPLKPDGGEVNYRGTRYQELIDEGAFDGGIFALLRKTKGEWTVVRYAIGATDVPYVDWPRETGAPAVIFEP
jgi:hypothetical protein